MSGRYYEAFGYWRTIDEWAWISGIPRRTIENRLRVGLPLEVCVNLPLCARIDPKAAPGAPMSWTWDALEFEDDDWARSFVKRHPDGATLDQVGEVLGMCRERVRQVEEQILRKLRYAGIRRVEELRAALEAA